ncbi:MAG TPA: sigma factor-like helix-turn-helix DNA-binding protein, partial [Urbifossiella sp.]|nr:sigma factor-like helix-turn-helix DNA-binding protein [Urbifossiella sp.]
AVARLPDLDRDIVRLRHLEQGLSFAEIGAVLNLSEGAARTRHHRALAELERLLSGHPALVRRAVARDPLTE